MLSKRKENEVSQGYIHYLLVPCSTLTGCIGPATSRQDLYPACQTIVKCQGLVETHFYIITNFQKCQTVFLSLSEGSVVVKSCSCASTRVCVLAIYSRSTLPPPFWTFGRLKISDTSSRYLVSFLFLTTSIFRG